MRYFCCDERRRDAVRGHGTLDGIDYLEVDDDGIPGNPERQRTLRVFFVKPPTVPPAPERPLAGRWGTDARANAALVRITGGERVRAIVVDEARWTSGHLEVHVTPRGDFSRYTLRLVEPATEEPLRELDPELASIDFSFKVECPGEFDCRAERVCATSDARPPDLDYLAKDYNSFRQLMLDRLSVVAPDWRERNAADLGVTLVETLAYVGDYLSYRQDAISTEAYLGTARSRVSVRRHARLLDYRMHDGCNARAWVQVRLQPNASVTGILLPRFVVTQADAHESFREAPPSELPLRLPDGTHLRPTRFLTSVSAPPVLDESACEAALATGPAEIFEPMEEGLLFPQHNEIRFHTWSDERCCLPRGATKATLKDEVVLAGGTRQRLCLRAGDVLVFVEKVGPRTGDAADASRDRRHVVRLTHVVPEALSTFDQDREVARVPGAPVLDPVTGEAVVEIAWATADALPFGFTMSGRSADGVARADVSVACGNLVLADQGQTPTTPERLPVMPSPAAVLAPVGGEASDRCNPAARRTAPARYAPRLEAGPVTQAASYDPTRPAAEALTWATDDVSPAVRLVDDQDQPWTAQRDLLASDAFAREFVVEVTNEGRAELRFGDDENGERPAEQTRFDAWYRVGNGRGGNVGSETIQHVVVPWVVVWDAGSGQLKPRSAAPVILGVLNWLPARGGLDPETLEHVRQSAPAAFRVQQRAVTPQDYADKAALHPEVQRAVATRRWTGSWHTMYLSVDRRGGRAVDASFEDELRRHLERYRLAGHDLEIDGPHFVALELELMACVEAHYFQSDVAQALFEVFGNQTRPDGRLGFFHPDRFTFGQPVLLSRIYAAAQEIAGIRHLEVTVLRRQGAPPTDPPVPVGGVLELDRLEIARLDNDANFPDRGVLRIQPRGGR